MEYGASAEDVARVCHAHPVSFMILNINYEVQLIIFITYINRHAVKLFEKPMWQLLLENQSTFNKQFNRI